MSEACDVSADGSTVVGFADSASGNEAFIWHTDKGMRSLHDVLSDDLGLDLTGWTLDNAMAISDDGLTVVGRGINPRGFPEAWIVVLINRPACLGDIDLDGTVGVGDLLIVLSQWGACPPKCPGDIDGDGTVDTLDLLTLLTEWGPCR